MRVKIVLPWHYLALLALGLAVLWALTARFGRTAPVMYGWAIGWLLVSRSVDYLMRRRRKRIRQDGDE